MSARPPRRTDARASAAPASSAGVLSIYRIPAVLALISVAGLLCALIGDGVFDALSWLALGAVVATMLWALCFRRQRGRR